MTLARPARTAWRALAKNKMRAGLTVLGVVIGIAAVTTMVSVGESAGALVQGQLQQLGTNVLIVWPGSQQSGGARGPTSGQAIYGNCNWKPREVQGVGADYLLVRNWPLQAGSFFEARDISSAAKV